MKNLIYLFLFLTNIILLSFSNNEDLYVPINIRNGYLNKTRSESGKPGPKYWQNRADYKINIELDPFNKTLKGNEIITYYNNSPTTLSYLIFHLFQNIYKKGNPRDSEIAINDISSGLKITSISIKGKKIDVSNNSILQYNAVKMKLKLNNPLKSGSKTVLSIGWEYKINKKSHIRSGMVDQTSFFIAYFFPRIAVYDDLNGWDQSQYTGTSEFYNDFGNFDVKIKVPENFIIWATGILQNPEEVLSKKYLNRYKLAINSTETIEIIKKDDILKGNITKNNNKKWRFKADNINDFAFGGSNHYCWDAKTLVNDKKTGNKTLIETAYSINSVHFKPVLEIAKESIDYMSNKFPGIPFPFPKESIFQGYADMEYPMMVNDAARSNYHLTEKVTFHEIFHSYFPFYTGLNETKYAWMDEGLTSFADNTYMEYKKKEKYKFFYFRQLYKKNIGYHSDIPIFASSNMLRSPVYYNNSYSKAGAFFLVLRNYLGKDLFKKCIQSFIEIWKGKHPTPYDFFNIFKKESKKSLNWLIKPWIFEYGYVDLSIKIKKTTKNSLELIIRKKGHYPVPVILKILYADGKMNIIKKNVSIWKDGKKEFILNIPISGKVKSVNLGDQRYNDADLSDNKIVIK